MDTKRFSALKTAITESRRHLKPFRTELADALRSYTGSHYGQNSGDDKPINMLELAVESLLQQLSSRAPQVICTTHNPELRSAAIDMKLALNQALKQIEFEKEHRLWVLSAIFLVGIMEVGLHTTESPEIDGEPLPMTDVFCETIMFDDFVFDTSATKWDRNKVGFWGHKYLVPLAVAKKDRTFDKDARKMLKSVERNDSDKGDTKNIAGSANSEEPFNNMCEIWQIFVPLENEVITFSMDGNVPLKTVKWKGPKNGPYHLIGFNPVLNNILPLAPVANWIALDDLENKLYTKLGSQAARQKTIGITDASGRADAEHVINASDGEVIAVGNPNAFKEASFGGVNQQTLGFALNVRSMADFVMGNLSAQMGLGSSANTLGQEQMIKQASSVRLGAMQGVLLSATQGVLRDIAFYLHKHPTIEYRFTRKFEGTTIELPLTWPRRDNGYGDEIDVRQGDFNEYEISITPYSMTEVAPGQRANLLRTIWREDILPAVPLGIQPDVLAYLNQLAEYLDLPELRLIVPETTAAMEPQQRGGGMSVPNPSKPNGNYTRNNVSQGMTQNAMDQQREMMAMSGGGE